MKHNILIEIIVTNQCNKRCSYCDLDFRSQFIQQQEIDNLYKILKNSRNEIGDIVINFFGGEPFLNFTIIEYTLQKYQDLGNIKFSIGTNGVLLSEEVFKILKRYNVVIYLSVDFSNYQILQQKIYLKSYENLFVNIILEPESVGEFFQEFHRLEEYKNLNFMPVYTTKIWDFSALSHLLNIFDIYKNIGTFFNYYNGFSSEKQFILETNGDLYQDLDSLLWLQCQYKIFEKKIVNFIQQSTKIGNINTLTFAEIIEKYNPKKIQQFVFLLEKLANTTRNNHLIKYIFSRKLSSIHKKIFLFQEFLKKYFTQKQNDIEVIFSAILQDSARENYYKNSLDRQLFDCSLEYNSQGEKKEYFKFSYFGSDIHFVRKIFSYFRYQNSLNQIEQDYESYRDFLKDDTITVGFKVTDGRLEELKVYYDLVKSSELLEREKIETTILVKILLKSYTFRGDNLEENKIYIPPDDVSFRKASEILSQNLDFHDFKNYEYYDILYRYSDETLKTIKFYYNLEKQENKGLQSQISHFFPNINLDFGVLNVERELGVDFSIEKGIKKYSLYFGLYR